jgi:DNA polymerase III delta subunit
MSEGSLFSSGRLLDISDVSGLSRKVKNELLEAAGDPSGNCILCRTTQSRISSGFLGKLEKAALTYVCWEPFQRDLRKWCGRLAAEASVSLTRDGSQTVELYSAGVLQRLAEAMERLSLYYTGGESIDRDGVLKVLTGRAEHTIFDLSDMLFTNRRSGAMDSLMSLIRAGEEPVAILAFLYSQWKMVNRARDIIASGGTSSTVSKELGIRYMQLDRVVAAAGKMYAEDPAGTPAKFASADLSLKTGGDSFTVLAGVIFALTSGRS